MSLASHINTFLIVLSLYVFVVSNLFAGWILSVLNTSYPLLPDEPVQFLTTDNEFKKRVGVFYTLPGEGSIDEKVFSMRCENKYTSQ